MSAGTRAAARATGPTGTEAAPDPAPRRRGPVARVVSVVLGVVMVALVVLAGAVVVVPRVLGATPLTVLSGSMERALSPGDVVVVRPVDPDELRTGDVVTVQPVSGDPTLVTHRVVQVDRDGADVTGLVTRGDANGAADAPLVPDQVMGRVAYSVPLVGHATNVSWGPTAVTVLAVALLVYAAVALVRPDRGRPTDPPREQEVPT